MKLIYCTIILLFSIQLSAQVSTEIFPVKRPSSKDHIDIIKLLVRYNNHLLKDCDSILVYVSDQVIDKVSLDNIRYQINSASNSIRYDSLVKENTIEYYQGSILKRKKEFDSQKRLVTSIVFESNEISKKTNYKYDKNKLVSEQTFEYWSAPPKSNLEEEILYKYKKDFLYKILHKTINPMNGSYNLYIRTFNQDKNLMSSETKMYSSEGDLYLNKIIDCTIDEKSNQITKIKSTLKETVVADLEYEDRNILLKMNY